MPCRPAWRGSRAGSGSLIRRVIRRSRRGGCGSTCRRGPATGLLVFDNAADAGGAAAVPAGDGRHSGGGDQH